MSPFTVDAPRDFLILQQDYLLSQLVSIRDLLNAQNTRSVTICDGETPKRTNLSLYRRLPRCTCLNESVVSLSETLLDVSEDAALEYNDFEKSVAYGQASRVLQKEQSYEFVYLLSRFGTTFDSDVAWSVHCTVANQPRECGSTYSDATKTSAYPPTGPKTATDPVVTQRATASSISSDFTSTRIKFDKRESFNQAKARYLEPESDAF